ncbi:hypothetical protein [Halobacillus litoralis]|uniref:Uncharacterized protein n=1 Tax=Halobacillus litoralis TaxID=45668 RepID=A0A410MJB1_9BACI|nr:hypothetical protein [Halobacillus litoralis]QAS54809.1 hypothetical protein HLI_21385 [Halobacillus litoralis]
MTKFLYWADFFDTIFRKNKLFWVVQILSFLFISIFFCQYIFFEGDYSPPNALELSSPIVQIGILAYLIIGSNLLENNSLKGVKSIYSSLHVQLDSLIGSIGFIVISSGFTIAFYYSYYSILLISSGTNIGSFFIDSLLYLILYWWVPFLTSGLLGLSISLWIKNHFKYVIMILVWLLVGPLNDLYLKDRLSLLFSWGEKEPTIPYHYLYGFAIEDAAVLEKFTWIMTILLILILSYFTKIKKIKIYKSIALALCFSVLIGLSFNQIHQYNTLLVGKGEQSIQSEIDKYQVYPNSKDNSDPEYEITEYDIDLALDNNLSANVFLNIENISENTISRLKFSLYSGFHIRYVKDNGNKIDYSRKYDQVKIQLAMPLERGESRTIEVSYSGDSSPIYFANEQAAYLPSNFPWIPKEVIAPAITVFENSIHRNNLNSFNEVKYELEFQGEKEVYTNINKIGEDIWSGVSTGGLSVIMGRLDETDYEGKKIIYPDIWNVSTVSLDRYFERFENNLAKINELFEGVDTTIPNTIFLLPNTFVNDFYFEEDYWLSKDHFILGIQRVFSIDEHILDRKSALIMNSLVPASTWKNSINPTDLDFVFLFNAIVSNYLSDGNEKVPKKYLSFVEMKINKQDKQVQVNVLTRVIELMEILSEEKKKEFLNDWYQLLIKKHSFGELSSLIVEYREERN